jgi:hypothetical protein
MGVIRKIGVCDRVHTLPGRKNLSIRAHFTTAERSPFKMNL